MGGFAFPAAIGLMGAGVGTQAVGIAKQSQAARKAARYNAEISKRQTGSQIDQMIGENNRQQSINVTRVAKSGVRLSGSPLYALAENINQQERQIQAVQQAGQMTQEAFRSEARNARIAGQVGIASSVLGGLGNIGALSVLHRGGGLRRA